MINYSILYSVKIKLGKYLEYLRLCCKISRIRLYMYILRIIFFVRGFFIIVVVRLIFELLRFVVY